MTEKVELFDLQIIKTIGMGTFNRVQLVKHQRTQKYYALKVINMQKVITAQQVEHVHREKSLLSISRHPFILHLVSTAKTDRNLYIITEFLSGGELYTQLYTKQRFPASTACFYAAEIACALQFLHGLAIVYRDLKPENLVFSSKGHVKLTDFGFSKRLQGKTFTLCGTAEYLAPEVVSRSGHEFPVDWWALGILTFEMLTGQPPFQGESQQATYDLITKAQPQIPDEIEPTSRAFIAELLEKDPTRRLGCVDSQVLQHPFFSKIDLKAVEAEKIQPPFVPELENEGDTFYFPPFDEASIEELPVNQKERDLFSEW
ncbi:unnamed protein product, partial [Mesorhabditis belari]|uniref:Uncharacterized protein n=1 Tax=Mesorhabditis belari TaxID=2138241 RepID=A0AAF3EAE5_9BILA